MNPVTTIDAFGLHPKWKSRVDGLGGTQAPEFPEYIFHTGFLEYGSGTTRWDIQFDRLRAKAGQIRFRLDSLPRVAGASRGAETVFIKDLSLSDLVASGGCFSLTADVAFDRRYALMALAQGGLDGDAQAVQVSYSMDGFDVRAPAPALTAIDHCGGVLELAQKTMITGATAPRFSDPASQPFTESQIGDPAYRHWLHRMGGLAPEAGDGWLLTYPLQCFERYGALRPGARALMLEPQSARSAVMRQAGVQVYWPVIDGDRWRLSSDPEPLEWGRAAEVISQRPEFLSCLPSGVDLMIVPPELSSKMLMQGVDRLIASACACLRSGGVAVISLFFIDVAERRLSAGVPPGLFTRHDLDRLGMLLLSKGLQVAEYRFDHRSAPGRTRVAEIGLGQASKGAAFSIVTRRP